MDFFIDKLQTAYATAYREGLKKNLQNQKYIMEEKISTFPNAGMCTIPLHTL